MSKERSKTQDVVKLRQPSFVDTEEKNESGFVFLLLLSAYIGLAPHSTANPAIPGQNGDKLLHAFDFFLLTLIFYWVLDTSRRRVLQCTAVVCFGILGVGSEIVQGLLPNGRIFDFWDIVANFIGCSGGLATCMWYHRHLLERRRLNRFGGNGNGREEEDLELGQREPLTRDVDHDHDHERDNAIGPQETGIISSQSEAKKKPTNQTLEEEVDNWDENAEEEEEDDEDDEDDDWDIEGDDRKSGSNVDEPGPTQSTSDMHSENDEWEQNVHHPLPKKKLRAD
ncbi:hypothetical protein KEM54_001396 [Ascosphaera aggregata]|nr:hypothetical protein KEM54_001396 [Ascosphaera aggregata]